MNTKPLIGFIGQGWIGKHYADVFEKRGFPVVRYAKEEPYISNREKIKECDIVFIAVPTPTSPAGFDDSIVRAVVPLVGKGKIAVIKSTLVPGTTESIQKENPDIFVFHSPEFLREASALYDAEFPERNIVGMPIQNALYKKKAKEVMDILPPAPYSLISSSKEAEVVKYAGNCFLVTKVVFMNMLYDFTQSLGLPWETVREAVSSDSRIGKSHMTPVHAKGRGAGGDCFIKDFEAFVQLYKKHAPQDSHGHEVLASLKEKNIKLLLESGKDLNLLEGVYGKSVKAKRKDPSLLPKAE